MRSPAEALSALTAANPVPQQDVDEIDREQSLALVLARREECTPGGPLAPRRRGRMLAATLAVAAIAIGVALISPWQGPGPNVVGRALAAIGSGPVLHVVLEYRSADNVVINLGTGAQHERIHRTEYWYDAERSLLHTRLATDGRQLTEIVERPGGADSDLGHYAGGFAGQLDPALAGFVTHYRQALADGSAKIVGHDTIDGRDVTLLEFALPPKAVEQVAIDSETYRPLSLAFHQRDGQASQRQRVAEIESVPRDVSYFAKPALSPPRPTGGGFSSGDEITREQAATALERPALWAGPEIGGLSLGTIRLDQVHTDWTDGRKTEGRKLELDYGGKAAPSLTIGEAASVTASYQLGFNDGGDPPAPEGSMVLTGERPVRGSGGTTWTGNLLFGGMYVQLQGTSRELVLEAARPLRPLPAP